MFKQDEPVASWRVGTNGGQTNERATRTSQQWWQQIAGEIYVGMCAEKVHNDYAIAAIITMWRNIYYSVYIIHTYLYIHTCTYLLLLRYLAAQMSKKIKTPQKATITSVVWISK